MFYIIRILLALALIAVFCLLVKKKKIVIKRKLMRYAAWAVILLVIAATYVFPLDEMLIKFDTMEDAYAYRFFSADDIKFSVEGDESGLALAKKNDTYYIKFFEKEDGKWAYQDFTFRFLIFDNADCSIYQYKETNDYYTCVWKYTDAEPSVSDSKGSVFYTYKGETAYGYSSYWYIACIHEVPSDYVIYDNGEEVNVTLD